MNITKERIIEILKNNKTDLYDESGNVIHGIDATDFEYAATEIINEINDKQHHADQLAEALRELLNEFDCGIFHPDATYEVLGKAETALTNYEQGKGNDGWISVEERLPTKAGLYIVWDTNYDPINGTDILRFHVSNQSWYRGADCFHPTHWRPLPAPPTNYENNKIDKA
jgi:hypothetical protein